MSDYSPGDGHTDEELEELAEMVGAEDEETEGPRLSDLEQQLVEEGWTLSGIVTLEDAVRPTGIDEEDLLLLSRGIAAQFTAIVGSLLDDDGADANVYLYIEPSSEVADQPDERADDEQDDEDDNDRGETTGEFHPDHLPGFLRPLFPADTPGVGGVPLGINDAGVSTPPSAAS